jgi:hypothetical protein
VKRLLCERETVTDTKHKMKGVRPPYMSVTGEEDFLNYNAVSPLTNGYCRFDPTPSPTVGKQKAIINFTPALGPGVKFV